MWAFKLLHVFLIYHGKCNIKILNNGFNMLEVDSSTHVSC